MAPASAAAAAAAVAAAAVVVVVVLHALFLRRPTGAPVIEKDNDNVFK
jgi:hypothetical protein